MDLRLCGGESRWSGLLCGDIMDKGTGIALAHGQQVRHYFDVNPATKVMIYQAKVSWDGGATLYGDELTHCVPLPPDHALDLSKVKEVCSGMGCMGLAASYLGLHCVAAMDWNPKVVEPVWDVILPIDELTWRTAKDHHSQASRGRRRCQR